MKAPRNKKRLRNWVVVCVQHDKTLLTNTSYPAFQYKRLAEMYSTWLQKIYSWYRGDWRVVPLAQALALLGAEPRSSPRLWRHKQSYMLHGLLIPYHPYTFIERRKEVADYAIGREVGM